MSKDLFAKGRILTPSECYRLSLAIGATLGVVYSLGATPESAPAPFYLMGISMAVGAIMGLIGAVAYLVIRKFRRQASLRSRQVIIANFKSNSRR